MRLQDKPVQENKFEVITLGQTYFLLYKSPKFQALIDVNVRDYGNGTAIGKMKIAQSGKVELYFSLLINDSHIVCVFDTKYYTEAKLETFVELMMKQWRNLDEVFGTLGRESKRGTFQLYTAENDPNGTILLMQLQMVQEGPELDAVLSKF